jgi:hypothetical protein
LPRLGGLAFHSVHLEKRYNSTASKCGEIQKWLEHLRPEGALISSLMKQLSNAKMPVLHKACVKAAAMVSLLGRGRFKFQNSLRRYVDSNAFHTCIS